MSRMLDAMGRLLPRRAPRPDVKASAAVKASAVGPLICWDPPGQPVWSPRDYSAFAREGFMQNAIVYRCVRMIAEGAASVPLLLYEGADEIEEHALLDLIAQPSPDHTSADFLESWYGFLLVAGNAYVEAVALGGTLRELHVLRPDRMKVIPGPDGWPEAYEYTAGGASVRFAEEPAPGVRPILHVRLFHPVNDHYGMSPIEAAASAIDLHNAASGWNKALLDNAARPSGALVYAAKNGVMTGEQFARLKAELELSFQGAKNAGRPLLLEGGLDWKSLSLSPKDMDFVEAKHAAAREIALALGVPPMLLGIPGDNTYSNYQEAQRAFWRATVLPLIGRMTKAFSAWLAPAWGGGLELRPDLDQVDGLSGEREALWARLDKAAFLTVDEKRAAVGYGPAPRADSAPPAAFGDGGAGAKFSPDQPRVPAGSSDGGQWTSGGGGGFVRLAQADTGTRSDAQERERQIAPADASEFNPLREGWHEYTTANQGCTAELKCPTEEMADQMPRFSLPGQDPSIPVVDRQIYPVYDPVTGLPGGFVETFVSKDGLTIINRTRPLHIFFDGLVERKATQNPDGSWTITTRGIGNNVIPGMNIINQGLGPKIFNELDRRLRESIERHHGVRKSYPEFVGPRAWSAGSGCVYGSASYDE